VSVRYLVASVLACACSKEAEAPKPVAPMPHSDAPAVAMIDAAAPLPDHQTYKDLGAALVAIIPADARVVGFGELHARTDRAKVRSSLAAFTAALPQFADKLSDLVIETWLVDPKCGKPAAQATQKIETTVKRPEETKSEIALLADAARAAKIQPHAMTLTCTDYVAIAPANHDVDPVAVLTLTTRELKRIATSAVIHRDKEPNHRPWIGVYGGALHNDRFPDTSVAEWSYAAEVDRVSHDHFVEVDIIVPELAEADPTQQKQPWYPLVATAHEVTVWKRGERSFVVLLPRS
jgi:hypothetical protein